MQLAKVVITSALVLAARVEGLPEGKRVLKCIIDVKIIFCTMAVIVVCSMITNCSVLTAVMDKSFSSSLWQKVCVNNIYTYCHALLRIHITGDQTYCKNVFVFCFLFLFDTLGTHF